MTTYREAIYMCNDLLKGMSDSFTFTEEHIAYLLDKFRALLLKQRYGNDPKKHVPYSNYQSLHVNFTPYSKDLEYFTSNTEVPYMLQIGIPRIVNASNDLTDNYYNFEVEYTSRERLPFVGNNKYTSRFYYCAINEKNRLLLKTKKSDWTEDDGYIGPTSFSLVGIFENPREVLDEISFKEDPNYTHEWDRNIPIEESLITTLIEMVVKELAGSVYRPNDDVNNNRDDNADMANYIRSNMKSNVAKQLE